MEARAAQLAPAGPKSAMFDINSVGKRLLVGV